MTYVFGARSRANLEFVDPRLVAVADRAITYTTIDHAVTEGLRQLERQKELYAKGWSETMNSKHLAQKPSGLSHAIDVMAVGDLDGDGDVDAQDKARTWSPVIYTEIAVAYKRAARELGTKIRWGGEFKHRNGKPFFDGPHFELVV